MPLSDNPALESSSTYRRLNKSLKAFAHQFLEDGRRVIQCVEEALLVWRAPKHSDHCFYAYVLLTTGFTSPHALLDTGQIIQWTRGWPLYCPKRASAAGK